MTAEPLAADAPESRKVIYKFASFELDSAQYRLSRDGASIEIKPAVLELLAYLIANRDRVVSKKELLAEQWDGRFVNDGALSGSVYEARRALGDDAATAVFIRTLWGRGYQFHFRPVEMIDGEAAASASDPDVRSMRCCLESARGTTPLHVGENGIGRERSSAIVLDGLRVSRHHARLLVSDDAAWLEDLGSKNGTRLNGRAVGAPERLSDGDVIEIGGFHLTYRTSFDEASTLTSEASSSRKVARRKPLPTTWS